MVKEGDAESVALFVSMPIFTRGMYFHHMKRLIISCLFLLSVGLLKAGDMRILGSSIVHPPVLEAVNLLRKQQNLEIELSSAGGVEVALASLGDHTAKIAMMARRLKPEDRAGFPDLRLVEIRVGEQVASLCVSIDVWKSGIHQVSAEQMRGIYEGRIQNWKELGGDDQKITFFNWEEGLGMWELLADWLYESSSRAPKGKFTAVGSNEEARNAVEFTKGSIALMTPRLALPGAICPLSLNQKGQIIDPNVENISSGLYPLIRPLVLVVDDRPTGIAKVVVDFLLSPKGQECFAKKGFFPVSELKEQE